MSTLRQCFIMSENGVSIEKVVDSILSEHDLRALIVIGNFERYLESKSRKTTGFINRCLYEMFQHSKITHEYIYPFQRVFGTTNMCLEMYKYIDHCIDLDPSKDNIITYDMCFVPMYDIQGIISWDEFEGYILSMKKESWNLIINSGYNNIISDFSVIKKDIQDDQDIRDIQNSHEDMHASRRIAIKYYMALKEYNSIMSLNDMIKWHDKYSKDYISMFSCDPSEVPPADIIASIFSDMIGGQILPENNELLDI